MTLDGAIKSYIRVTYSDAFKKESPHAKFDMCTRDMMEFAKGDVPEKYLANTLVLIRYFFFLIINLFSFADLVIICFDKESPEVKKMVCHESRYERRCKKCKDRNGKLPKGRQVKLNEKALYFDPECDKGCFESQILWREEGPHLPYDENQPLSFKNDWMKFASDSRNLRDELFPRIANTLLSWRPKPGQCLMTSGIPFYTREVVEYEDAMEQKGFTLAPGKRQILDFWTHSSLPLVYDEIQRAKLFNRVFVFDCNRREELPELYNDIQEADNGIFFFGGKFFPHLKKKLYIINDGDAISIGALMAYEDMNQPEVEHILCLPVKGKKASEYRYEYVNLKLLCELIEKTPQFVNAGVQSPLATMVFLIILSETDFFKGEFCFGIGTQTKWNDDDEKKRQKQTHGVWDTFFSKIDMFSHLVQYYVNVRDHNTERVMVLDEELFNIFTKMCYTNKYNGKNTYEEVKIHCSSMKDPRKHAPDDQVILRWGRQILWNLNYWANDYRNIKIDPFETYMDKPLYGYVKGAIVNDVSRKQKKIDEVHKRHFWKRKQGGKPELKPIPEKRKKEALELMKGFK